MVSTRRAAAATLVAGMLGAAAAQGEDAARAATIERAKNAAVERAILRGIPAHRIFDGDGMVAWWHAYRHEVREVRVYVSVAQLPYGTMSPWPVSSELLLNGKSLGAGVDVPGTGKPRTDPEHLHAFRAMARGWRMEDAPSANDAFTLKVSFEGMEMVSSFTEAELRGEPAAVAGPSAGNGLETAEIDARFGPGERAELEIDGKSVEVLWFGEGSQAGRKHVAMSNLVAGRYGSFLQPVENDPWGGRGADRRPPTAEEIARIESALDEIAEFADAYDRSLEGDRFAARADAEGREIAVCRVPGRLAWPPDRPYDAMRAVASHERLLSNLRELLPKARAKVAEFRATGGIAIFDREIWKAAREADRAAAVEAAIADRAPAECIVDGERSVAWLKAGVDMESRTVWASVTSACLPMENTPWMPDDIRITCNGRPMAEVRPQNYVKHEGSLLQAFANSTVLHATWTAEEALRADDMFEVAFTVEGREAKARFTPGDREWSIRRPGNAGAIADAPPEGMDVADFDADGRSIACVLGRRLGAAADRARRMETLLEGRHSCFLHSFGDRPNDCPDVYRDPGVPTMEEVRAMAEVLDEFEEFGERLDGALEGNRLLFAMQEEGATIVECAAQGGEPAAVSEERMAKLRGDTAESERQLDWMRSKMPECRAKVDELATAAARPRPAFTAEQIAQREAARADAMLLLEESGVPKDWIFANDNAVVGVQAESRDSGAMSVEVFLISMPHSRAWLAPGELELTRNEKTMLLGGRAEFNAPYQRSELASGALLTRYRFAWSLDGEHAADDRFVLKLGGRGVKFVREFAHEEYRHWWKELAEVLKSEQPAAPGGMAAIPCARTNDGRLGVQTRVVVEGMRPLEFSAIVDERIETAVFHQSTLHPEWEDRKGRAFLESGEKVMMRSVHSPEGFACWKLRMPVLIGPLRREIDVIVIPKGPHGRWREPRVPASFLGEGWRLDPENDRILVKAEP